MDEFAEEIKVQSESDYNLLVGESGSIQETVDIMHNSSSQEGKKITWFDGLKAILTILRFWITNDSSKKVLNKNYEPTDI